MRPNTRSQPSQQEPCSYPKYRPALLLLALVLGLTFFGTANAAEFAEGEIYRLKADETITDDLYIFAQEIIIDGTVEGDVIAFGGIIEINGVVTGDLMAAGAGITINGEVQDDVRAAGAGIVIAGVVGDDVVVAGGGGFPGMPINIGNNSVTPGIRVTQGAQIGGDMIVAGDRGAIAGQISDDIFAGMNSLEFNAQVGGDAQLYARTLTFGNAAQVGGTLRYSTEGDPGNAENVATNVVSTAWAQPDAVQESTLSSSIAGRLGWWLVRLLLVSLGLTLAGWLLLTFVPEILTKPAAAFASKPVEAGIAGVIFLALIIPLGAALVFLGGVFWGPFPGAAAMFAAFFGLLGLVWIFSPLVTGLWLGQKLLSAMNRDLGTLPTMLLGALIIVVLARLLGLIPCAGQAAGLLLYLISFAFALGSGLMAWLRPTQTESVPSDDEPSADSQLQQDAASSLEDAESTE